MQKQNRLHFGIGALAVPLVIGGLAMLDSHPLISYVLFVVGGASFAWGVWPFIFHKRRKQHLSHTSTSRPPLPKINYEKIDDVTPEDKKQIGFMGTRMMSTHGHIDLTGLMSDRANGVPLDDLMTKPCSVCGVRRNMKGTNR